MSFKRGLLIALLIVSVLIVIGGLLQPLTLSTLEPFSPPGLVTVMGTDQIGRDLWKQLSDATLATVIITSLSCLWACLGGLAIGGYSGLSQSHSAFILMRIVDVFMPIPSIMLGMILLIALPDNAFQISLAIGLPLISFTARHCRALVLPLAGKDFVKAAKLAGGSTFYIIRTHIITSLRGELSALFVTTFSWSLVNLTSLDFLGLLGNLSFVSLGKMLNEGRLYLFTAPWMIISPGLMVILIMICLNLLMTSESSSD